MPETKTTLLSISLLENLKAAGAGISSDEPVPSHLPEPVPQCSIKGFCCSSPARQNQHHTHCQARAKLWGALQERRNFNSLKLIWCISVFTYHKFTQLQLDLVALRGFYHIASLLHILTVDAASVLILMMNFWLILYPLFFVSHQYCVYSGTYSSLQIWLQ